MNSQKDLGDFIPNGIDLYKKQLDDLVRNYGLSYSESVSLLKVLLENACKTQLKEYAIYE